MTITTERGDYRITYIQWINSAWEGEASAEPRLSMDSQ
ncbi:MAG: hypothetical protein JWP89_306 [Schlesneria sp.]|nr:hypothetical protein [Schlesneria sp.]